MNLDGVYISRGWAIRGSFFDLERVEVLKGPQGTLYGRNASGGAINLISARPNKEFGGYVEAEVGDYDLWRGTGAVNICRRVHRLRIFRTWLDIDLRICLAAQRGHLDPLPNGASVVTTRLGVVRLVHHANRQRQPSIRLV